LSKEDKEARAQARAELRKLTKKRNKKKKKKEKKRRTQSIDSAVREPSSAHVQHAAEHPPTHSYAAPKGLIKPTPAFVFFLNDNRFKIERVLSRKHKYFNRMPKGMERNELIAREAAIWWVRLRPSDHRRYLNMSMRDFEERVVEWKEDKSIREMTMAGDLQDRGEETEVQGGVTEQYRDLTPEDEMITYQHHQRLYQDTSVGSKPFTPEPGKSNNRLLLELLQDMRFHPLPMFSANREDEEPGQMDYGKMSIPYFEVHGPVATSVGDECQGCTRGWNHFCPVLKRSFPAVESRAKLQPPLSSLMATRVGLGLQPRVETEAPEDDDETWRNAEPFSEKPTTDAIEAKRLPPIPSYALSHPSSRADDIVHFVEEAVAMKVPEPPRPSSPSAGLGSSKRSFLSRGALPIHGRKKRTVASYPSAEVNKCGRCRTVIQNDTGCVQCRRAQLVINMSKQHPPATPVTQGRKGESKVGSGLLKAQTTMLGRLSAKDSNFDQQTEGEKAISSAMLSRRWSPNVVLPPQKILFPKHHPSSSVYAVTKFGTEGSTDDEENVAAAMADLAELSSKDIVAGGSAAAIEDEIHTEYGDSQIVSSASDKPEESSETRASRRQRTTRRVAETPVVTVSETDRQQIAKEHQAEAVQLNKRCLTVASCGILLAMMRRDPLLLFAEPVPANVEAYSKIVPNPIDFGKIRSRVLDEEYTSLGAFISDARLLCRNALAYNPSGTIYSKTAKELYDVLEIMQKRASDWMTAIKSAHASSFAWRGTETIGAHSFHQKEAVTEDDPFKELRQSWPEAVEILESGDWLRNQIASDFMRTKENETAFYGSMAVRRAAVAAEGSLAAYPDSGGVYTPVVRRSHVEDEALRATIDKRVADMTNAAQLKDMPTWREDAILRMLRRVQHRRVEGRVSSKNGCARCDGLRVEQEAKMGVRSESVRWGRNKRKGEVDTVPRVAPSRLALSTGLGSVHTRELIDKKRKDAKNAEDVPDSIGEVGVSVRGSSIHGWGLFAEQPFKAGDVVAEYVGEYVSHAVADAREKMYQERRIQDYQFRADEMVVDATMKGGHGRYINHNCDPNCLAKIVEGRAPNRHLKRVIIIAQRSIKAREEITYDYQFPLELDLDSRIPCNCGSPLCRGFMNWDLPEKGSKDRVVRPTRRGGNMRDRIRRLGRPLKRGEH
jgi:histone-lysine N-methyltransferase SETD1